MGGIDAENLHSRVYGTLCKGLCHQCIAVNRTMSHAIETWLRPNRRVLLMAAVAPALLVLLGLAVALDVVGAAPPRPAHWRRHWRLLGGVLLAVLTWFFRQPRLAYDGRHLLVNLRAGRSDRRADRAMSSAFSSVRACGELPGRAGREVQMSQLRVRLAERATEWAAARCQTGPWAHGAADISRFTAHGASRWTSVL